MNHSNEKETKENHPKKVSFNYNVEQLPSNSEGLPTGYTCYICEEGACENRVHEDIFFFKLFSQPEIFLKNEKLLVSFTCIYVRTICQN